jgi:transposase-like protein
MKNHKYIRYSEAFKRQVVEQIESGKFHNAWHARRSLGIRGTTTVIRWLRQYGTDKCIPKCIKIMSLKEIDETKELKKRVRSLESALADAQMRSLLSDSYLKIACERMDTDPEQFKKNTPRRYPVRRSGGLQNEGLQYRQAV